ncbi:hypothetical protein E2C01_085772 [Portunus trituberculatus]|uniref:Uncharacterized protein n=1 Tax=Portunus trituberculatus TaxID=210409 RepID=A0A5B7J8G7_PORTR|nr:hypothetical protein [Portunus trituberculatus]
MVGGWTGGKACRTTPRSGSKTCTRRNPLPPQWPISLDNVNFGWKCPCQGVPGSQEPSARRLALEGRQDDLVLGLDDSLETVNTCNSVCFVV